MLTCCRAADWLTTRQLTLRRHRDTPKMRPCLCGISAGCYTGPDAGRARLRTSIGGPALAKGPPPPVGVSCHARKVRPPKDGARNAVRELQPYKCARHDADPFKTPAERCHGPMAEKHRQDDLLKALTAAESGVGGELSDAASMRSTVSTSTGSVGPAAPVSRACGHGEGRFFGVRRNKASVLLSLHWQLLLWQSQMHLKIKVKERWRGGIGLLTERAAAHSGPGQRAALRTARRPGLLSRHAGHNGCTHGPRAQRWESGLAAGGVREV